MDNIDIDKIILLKEKGMSWAQIGKELGASKEAIRSKYRRYVRRYGEQNRIASDTTAAEEFVKIAHDGSNGQMNDWRSIAGEAARRQSFRDKTFGQSPQAAEINIATNDPVVLVFTGDWHLGAGRTNYEAWLEDITMLMQTDGVYMIDVGDDRENIRRFKTLSAVFAQVLTPSEQAVLIRGIVNELTERGKLLAKVGGNHDIEFDERAGFAELTQAYVYEKMKAPLFQNRGLVHLTVGDALYKILVFHKSRFRSFLTPTHGARRELMLAYPGADIVAGGHDHQPGIEVFWYNMMADNLPTLLLKVGTYSDGIYGRRYFHNGGFPVNPSVVLYPQERKMLPFADPRDAIAYVRVVKGECA